MPEERGGKLYLNQDESLQLLDVSSSTFKNIERDYELKARTFVGKSRQRFFLKEAIELIRDRPVEDIEEVKEQIRKMQNPDPQNS